MSRGFLICAEGDEYLRQAYLCALSLLKSSNKYPVSLVTNDVIENEKFRKVFDQILPIPWYHYDDSKLRVKNRWKLYHVTPYENTIVLDSDVLVLQDLEYFWDIVEDYDVYYPSNVLTYRKELVKKDNFYRKTFYENNLVNYYNTVHFFKKCDFSFEFYKWLEFVVNNWEHLYGIFCKNSYPNGPSMDLNVAITAKILDCEGDITNFNQTAPSIVHMKPKIQGWYNENEVWQNCVKTILNNKMELKIGNYIQDSVFHYTEDDFLTEDIIKKYEKCLNL